MDSLKMFMHMGGYAFYVWSAYGLALALLAWPLLLSWKRLRKLSQQEKTAP